MTQQINVDGTYLRFDVNDPKFYEKITSEIPAFADYTADYINGEHHKVKIFQWVVIMYDMHSPLRTQIKGLYDRKVYAANIVGLGQNKASGKFKDYVEDILIGLDTKVNDLIVKYVSFQSSPEYTQFVAHAQIQQSMLQRIIANDADDKVQKMFDASTEKLTKLTNVIYGTGTRDEVYEARKALYQQASYDLSIMRPEAVARKFAQDGELPDEFNPYEEGYKPGDMHFIGDDPQIAKFDEEALP